MNRSDKSTTVQAPCRFLRCKEMYFREPDAAETEAGGGAYWCQQTQESFGPDGQPACKEDCAAGRACYQGG